jgi:hypothetical protein
MGKMRCEFSRSGKDYELVYFNGNGANLEVFINGSLVGSATGDKATRIWNKIIGYEE